MSSRPGDITVPGRPQLHEVSAGIYAYVQPDGTPSRAESGPGPLL
jgi:cyclase